MDNVLQTLVVQLMMDSSKYSEGIDKAINQGNSLTNGLSAVGGAVVTSALAVTGAAVVGLTGFLIDCTKGAADAEKIQAQLNSVLESTGGISGMTSESVNDLSTSLSQVTPFEDDVITSTQNMLLTFTNLGKNIFPATTETALDMATAMGTDTKSAAIMLGKALNDPTKGISALTRVGVTFTDEQQKLIEKLQKSGDLEGAQKVILQELQKEFGGSAKAAGKTFAGSLEILNNQFGNIKDSIGGALLPVLTDLATKFSTWLSDPAIQSGITNIANGIASFASTAISYLPQVIDFFKNMFDFLINNQGVVVGIIAAITAAVAFWAYTTITAAIPAIVAFMTAAFPVIAVLALIGVAAYLLYQAWTTNFGGIRDTLTNFWNETLMPVFESIRAWLAENLPIAIQALTDFWNNTLLPAFQAMGKWLSENLPVALQKLSDFWKNILLPALTAVWDFLSKTLYPLLQAIAEFLAAVFGKAVEALGALWKNVLLPALKDVWGYLSDNVLPIFRDVANWLSTKLTPAFSALGDIIRRVTGWIHDLATSISNLSLPSWMQPGSPMPLTIAMWGLNDALKAVASRTLPEFESQLNIRGVVSSKTKNAVDSNIDNNNDEYSNGEKRVIVDIDYDRLFGIFKEAVAQAVG